MGQLTVRKVPRKQKVVSSNPETAVFLARHCFTASLGDWVEYRERISPCMLLGVQVHFTALWHFFLQPLIHQQETVL